MLTRKDFLRKAAMSAGAIVAGPQLVEAADYFATTKLTILHTNDVHSRIDPFPMDGGRNQGLGGVAARAAIIERIRREEKNVLLVDAGDIFQGTPYFNFYKGEAELKAMSVMGYEACTIGNHEFDLGLENLALQLTQHAKFPMLVANYDFTDTPMEGKTIPYKIIKKDKLKIGILGLGIEMKGLVADFHAGNTKYLDPIATANTIGEKLKREKGCDLIICLSHLGYDYASTWEPNKVSDRILARETEFVDVIIGGHTHTFMNKPEIVKNKRGNDVVINQVGFAGINLGRLDFEFSKFSGKKILNSTSITVSEKTSG